MLVTVVKTDSEDVSVSACMSLCLCQCVFLYVSVCLYVSESDTVHTSIQIDGPKLV